jgi:hypothetical protein
MRDSTRPASISVEGAEVHAQLLNRACTVVIGSSC